MRYFTVLSFDHRTPLCFDHRKVKEGGKSLLYEINLTIRSHANNIRDWGFETLEEIKMGLRLNCYKHYIH